MYLVRIECLRAHSREVKLQKGRRSCAKFVSLAKSNTFSTSGCLKILTKYYIWSYVYIGFNLDNYIYYQRCVLWDLVSDGWTSSGCTTVHSNSTHTSCSCQYLATYTVIQDKVVPQVFNHLFEHLYLVLSVLSL